MPKPNTGGPAFPTPAAAASSPADVEPANPVEQRTSAPNSVAHCGITVRDYFAAKAMQSLIVSTSTHRGAIAEVIKETAEVAYRIADAMIEASK